MNNTISTNLVRFFIILLAQVLVFQHISFSLGSMASIHFIIYPAFILLLPIKTPKALMLVLAFIFGIIIDMFYNSPGVNAAALVFTAYIRNIIIAFLEPYEGYNIDDVPTIKKMGLAWVVSYISIALLIHIFVYFSVEAFSFVYFFETFLNTIFSFFVSFIVIIIFHFIFRTKY